MLELEFETYGVGLQHAEHWTRTIGERCPHCHGRRLSGPSSFPVTCPRCKGKGQIFERKEVPE